MARAGRRAAAATGARCRWYRGARCRPRGMLFTLRARIYRWRYDGAARCPPKDLEREPPRREPPWDASAVSHRHETRLSLARARSRAFTSLSLYHWAPLSSFSPGRNSRVLRVLARERSFPPDFRVSVSRSIILRWSVLLAYASRMHVCMYGCVRAYRARSRARVMYVCVCALVFRFCNLIFKRDILCYPIDSRGWW